VTAQPLALPFAHERGISFALGFLVGIWATCPKCGHGTRTNEQAVGAVQEVWQKPRIPLKELK